MVLFSGACQCNKPTFMQSVGELLASTLGCVVMFLLLLALAFCASFWGMCLLVFWRARRAFLRCFCRLRMFLVCFVDCDILFCWYCFQVNVGAPSPLSYKLLASCWLVPWVCCRVLVVACFGFLWPSFLGMCSLVFWRARRAILHCFCALVIIGIAIRY